MAARFKEYQREAAYRFYVTDSLFYSGQNKYLGYRLEDVYRPKPVDNRSGDEIAVDVITRLGLRFE